MTASGRCEKCGNPFDDHILPKAQTRTQQLINLGTWSKPICVPERKKTNG